MLDEIGAWLEDQTALGLSVAGQDPAKTALWIGAMQDSPAVQVVLYDPPGLAPLQTLRTTPHTVQPNLQLMVRAPYYDDAMVLAWPIWTALASVVDQSLPDSSGAYYQAIMPLQAPFKIGVDPNDATLVGANFQVMRERSDDE